MQVAKGVPGLESAPSIGIDNSDDNSGDDEDEYCDSDSDTSNSEEEYGYTIATKEEYEPPVELKQKTKTRGGKQGVGDTEATAGNDDNTTDTRIGSSDWNQIQQKALEQAIKMFPKGTDERWERIASKVVDKNKEECIIRYKCLAEMVKKKKQDIS